MEQFTYTSSFVSKGTLTASLEDKHKTLFRSEGRSNSPPSMDLSLNDEDIILSYDDAVLRRLDLGILRGPHFINDRIIEFYFSYLSTSYSLTDVLLVPPSISFWAMHCLDTSSFNDVMKPLNLSEKRIIIFTINDNEDVCVTNGGAHWSLLAYDREMNTFVHHDSLGRLKLNERHAIKLFKSIQEFLKTDARFVEGCTPDQHNGYDCGLYGMAIAKTICNWWCKSGSKNEGRWFSDVMEDVTYSSVNDLRKEVLVLIESLMEQRK